MATSEIGLPLQETKGKAKPASPFRALRHSKYRYFWFSTLVSNSGDWMDQVALNWLVLDLTGSAVYLGIVNACRAFPMIIFTLVGGAVADRFERRRLLILTQSVAMVLAIALGFLAQVRGDILLILGVATLRGIMMSFNLPARQALISELVPPHDLMAAISLNTAALNLSRVIGPSIGGILIAVVGVAGAFYFNAATFIVIIFTLFSLGSMPPPPGKRETLLRSVQTGVTTVWGDSILRPLIIIALVPLVLGMTYQPMTAVFAKDVFHTGSVGLGILTSAGGIGSFVGSISVGAYAGVVFRRGHVMFGGIVLLAFAMIALALAPSMLFGTVALFLIGAGSTGYTAANNTLLQLHAPEGMRARVLSMLFLARGIAPIGAIAAGFGVEIIGAPATMAAFGVTILILVAVAATSAPTARDLA